LKGAGCQQRAGHVLLIKGHLENFFCFAFVLNFNGFYHFGGFFQYITLPAKLQIIC
jgi:hypothetical protein